MMRRGGSGAICFCGGGGAGGSGSTSTIAGAIRTALQDEAFRGRVANCENPYGNGTAGERVANVLAAVPLDDRLRYKVNTF